MNSPTDYLQAEFESLVPPPLPVDRRGFLVTALGAGFALAVQPVMAQTAITTDGEGLTAGEIQVPTADGGMPAYRAQPARGANFPVILVVQEIFGVHEHIKDVCRRLAKAGLLQAIAPGAVRAPGRSVASITEPSPRSSLAKVVSKVPDKPGHEPTWMPAVAFAARANEDGDSRQAWASPASAGAGASPGCTPPTTPKREGGAWPGTGASPARRAR
jgi:hypothetical protein